MMKNLFLCIVLWMGIESMGQAQFRKIPEEVQEAFYKKYPEAEEATWKNKEKIFQVSFLLMGIKFTADFDAHAIWLQCAQEIKPEGIPRVVKHELDKTVYKEWLIKEVFFIVGSDDRTLYKILVFKNEVQQRYLLFDAAEGKLLEDTKGGRKMQLL